MNRRELAQRLAARIAGGEDGLLGIMLVRLQRLQEFRLVHGYEASDAAGAAAFARTRELMRPVDEVVQVAENEFIALMPRLRDAQHALLAGARVVRAFEETLGVGGHSVLAPVAVGISLHPEHGDNPDTLLRRAELALRDAKRSTDRCAVFEPGTERMAVPYESLHDALRNNMLEAHFEPIVDLRSNTVAGYESLARWTRSGFGEVRPDVFIRLAEDTGLIGELTRWSVNTSLRHAAQIRACGVPTHVSINISPRVFGQRDIVAQVTSALSVWEVPAEDVTLEVTESALMEDPVASMRLLDRLRGVGLGIAIDDFGAGYSSLAYLKQFPATELKIDRGFVTDMREDQRSARVVRSIIDLGHHLDVSVVAEGVEDAETLQLLRALGCDRAQGYHVGHAEPADALVERLRAGA